jgi:hypothetical protein
VVRPRRSLAEDLIRGDALGDALERQLAPLRRGPLREGAFPSRLHDERVASILGIALGVSFLICFLTGLVSHFAQHPLDLGFLSMPASPSWLYAFTQGLHVATGIATFPLLTAKLWTAYPHLFTWPPLRNLTDGLERVLVAVLIAASIFQLFTGLLNTAHWYLWTFDFTVAHYWTAWIVFGALLVHIGAKLGVVRRALRRGVARAPEPPGPGLSRRGFLGAVGLASAAVTVTTVGQTLGPLRGLDLLAPRDPADGPQGFPVNKSAAGAGVLHSATNPAFALSIGGRGTRAMTLSLAQLRALPQHEATLPIACVEGWSAQVHWRGVRVRDLLALAGAPDDAQVVVQSLQKHSIYGQSRLNQPHVRHPDTLLALSVNGEDLHIDHGYPVRLIAPNRPGVQQTKWVHRVVVV